MSADPKRCLECGRMKGLLSFNYAGDVSILGYPLPGEKDKDFLCAPCSLVVAKRIREQANRDVVPTRERTYRGLGLPLDAVAQEVLNFLTARGYENPRSENVGDVILVTGGDFGVRVSGQASECSVAAGTSSHALASAQVQSPVVLAAQGFGKWHNNRKLDDLFEFLDNAVYARAQVARPSTQDDTSRAADVPARLRDLAKLHGEGIITDDDFQKKKADLLSKL